MEVKVCSICKRELPETEEFFQLKTRRKKGFYARCRSCENTRINKWKSANPDRVRMYTQRKEKLSRRFDNLSCLSRWNDRQRFGSSAGSIHASDLKEIYENQNGTCFYTGLKMTWSGLREDQKRNPLAMSVDRRNNQIPHTRENVVLVCLFVNVAKAEWSVDELKVFWGRLPRA